jgi:hypothetical protein
VQVESVDAQTLTPVVRAATGNAALEISRWTCTPIHAGGGAATGGIYRFSGEAGDGPAGHPWSVILKVVQIQEDGADTAGSDDWRREAFAYSSSELQHLPPGVGAPRCFGVLEHVHERWLWLEDLTEPERQWSLDHYHAASRCLGKFNGAYLAGRAVPADSWWSHGWLRSYVESAAPALDRLPALMKHPLIQRLFPDRTADQVGQVWARRNMLLDYLDRAPQTFCHLDANRRNLFLRVDTAGRQELRLVDWAFAGSAPIGQELTALVVGSVVLYAMEPADLAQLERAALAGYAEGLEAAGCTYDRRQIRAIFAAAAALRYNAYILVRMPVLLDERRREWAERVLGHSLENFIDRCVEVRHYLLNLAAEALRSTA